MHADSLFRWFVSANWPAKRGALPADFLRFCFDHRKRCNSQLFQDLFVLFVMQEKHGGFFVEFGATDGVDLSNTMLLERHYGWSGILAEPAVHWQDALRQNRRAAIDPRCVWTKTGLRLAFAQTEQPELSTLAAFSTSDFHAEERRKANRYDVDTVSLNDLLAAHGAPREVDYLSLDTEGSEYEILSAFDFSAYDVGIITVEHNYGTQRNKICELLAARGYRRAYTGLSKWDDWYVKASRFPDFLGSMTLESEGTDMDVYAESEPLALVGPGWYRVEKSPRGEDFRWVGPDASLNVARLTPEGQLVQLDVEPGPAVGLKRFKLGVFEDGARLAGLEIDGRTPVEVLLPAGEPRVHKLSLHAEEPGEPVEAPGDKRTLSFRVFKIQLMPLPAGAVKDISLEKALEEASLRIGQLEELLGAERRERSELERRLTREIEGRDVVIGRLESVGVQARDEIQELSRTAEERQRKIDELQALADERLNVIRAMHETSETR